MSKSGSALSRLPDWEARLAAHTDAMRAATYQLGECDCGTAAAGAVMAVTGVDVWPQGLAAYDTHKALAKALRRKKWRTLDDVATAMLGAPIPPLAAHSGDVVSDGSALGWMTPSGPVALSEDGFVMLARNGLVAAWAAGRA